MMTHFLDEEYILFAFSPLRIRYTMLRCNGLSKTYDRVFNAEKKLLIFLYLFFEAEKIDHLTCYKKKRCDVQTN